MVQWEQLQERQPFNEFLGCSWLSVSLPVKQYSLSYPDCCFCNSMGKGTWGVKRKCKGRVLCVRVCGHVHAQGRMLWKRFWRCFLPHLDTLVSCQVFVLLYTIQIYYKENICFYWLILWHLKQLLCSLTSNISTHLDLLGHLSADTWDLWPLLLDNSISNSLGNLSISAPVLCFHQRTIFVLPCYSFDYNAELQGEARSHFCITIFLLFISLLFRGVHYGHITCASMMSGVGCQKTSVWWGGWLLWRHLSSCHLQISGVFA